MDLGAACGIVTAACGTFSCGMLDLVNCQQDLYCGMEFLNCGMWDLFCSMRIFFSFGSMWDLFVAACRSYKLSMYDLCCSMQDLLFLVCGRF